jgi:hypothetical protein
LSTVGGLVAECVARGVAVVGAAVLGAAVLGAGVAGAAVVSGTGSARGDAEPHAPTAATKAKAIAAVIR